MQRSHLHAGHTINLPMKQFLLLIAIASFSLVACKKEINNGCGCAPPPFASQVYGKWQMMAVKDNATGETLSKPVSIQGEVEIALDPTSEKGGFYSGSTPTNYINQSKFEIAAPSSISFKELNMSKVNETSWGSEFADNIQSATSFYRTGKGMGIITTKKTLIFERQ